MRSGAASPSRPASPDGSPPATVRAALRAAGLAALDAEVLLGHVLGVERTALHLNPQRRLGRAEAARFATLAERRRAGEPVAYLTGRRAFRHLELTVDPRVLIPRPETETLVEAALELPRGARVVDVGTGSGAVALALKHERPDLEVLATDRSDPALAVARANAARLGLEVGFRRGDLLEGVEGPLDAVLANPPYVADGDPLAPDVRKYEPRMALFAGADGLSVVRRLVPAAAARAPFLALEVGFEQADAVGALCRTAGYGRVEARPDLGGIERVVVARRC